MSKRLYVGNLPFTYTSQELETLFSQIGEVLSAKIILDRENGRSKGFAFVEMASDELGARAISTLNDKEVGGRLMKVTAANPKPEKAAGTGHRFGGQRQGGFSRGGNRSFSKD